MSLSKMLIVASLVAAAPAIAQTAPATGGTLVIVPAVGEVTRANDEGMVIFSVEEFDKDKTAAASRVNRKMKEGVEIVRREDPQARLKTRGYYTFPVYPEAPPRPLPMDQSKPLPVGWRVGQYLEVKTSSLGTMPKMAAAAQKVLSISGVQFGLSPQATKQLDDERIAATYRNLNERIVSIASAMGRKPSDAVIDTVDFEASGNYAPYASNKATMSAARTRAGADEIPEPSFEPGETTLEMRLVGKVKFK